MSLKKVTLASFILLGLTACGSSGGSSSTNTTSNDSTLKEVEKNLATTSEELKALKIKNQANTEALEKAKAELIQAQENLKSVQADRNAIDTALLEAQNKLKVAEESKARIMSELNAQISQKNTQIEQLNNEINQAKQQAVLANENLEKAKENLKTLQADKNATAEALLEAQNNLKAAEENKARISSELNEQLSQKNTQIAQLNNEINQAKQQAVLANENLEKAKENLKTLQADKNATNTALLETQNKLKVAEESNARIISELNAQISQKNTQIAQLSSEITQIKNDLNLANANLIKAQTDLKAVENDKTKTVTELTAAQEKLKEAETAKATAENKLAGKQRVIDAIHSQILQLENTYYDLGYKHHSEYPLGFHKTANISISPAVENVGDGILTADQYIYKQIFSSVLARTTKDSSMWDDTNFHRFRVDGVISDLVTETLQNEGSATYIGKAFHADQLGALTYNVNFKERTGEGKLSGFDKFADITLEKGNIENIQMRYQNTDVQGIKSNASMTDGTTGKYELGFFGPNAEEIAGEVYIFKHLDGSLKSNGHSAQKYGYAPERGTMFGFGGIRGEIQK